MDRASSCPIGVVCVRAADAFAASGYDLVQLAASLTQTDAFRYRRTQEDNDDE